MVVKMKSYFSPFPKGTKYEEIPDELSEYNFFSHKRFVSTREAKDLAVDIGTPILTIENGVIVSVKNDSDRYINPKIHSRYKVLLERNDSINEKLRRLEDELMEFAKKYTNYVQVSQVDGCIAEYVHLDKNTQVIVKQKVKQGDRIGFVGMTGVTDRPHLHLNIFENVSVPFELRER